jgi:hypothetical protein
MHGHGGSQSKRANTQNPEFALASQVRIAHAQRLGMVPGRLKKITAKTGAGRPECGVGIVRASSESLTHTGGPVEGSSMR